MLESSRRPEAAGNREQKIEERIPPAMEAGVGLKAIVSRVMSRSFPAGCDPVDGFHPNGRAARVATAGVTVAVRLCLVAWPAGSTPGRSPGAAAAGPARQVADVEKPSI
jgi:hypothetical protein